MDQLQLIDSFFKTDYFCICGNKKKKKKEEGAREMSSCSALNSPGARADLPPLELFFDPLFVVIMQLINVGAVIPINTSRVQVNYPDAT